MRNSSRKNVQIPRCLGALAMAATLCSCTLFIPENQSSPRYNTVVGAPRTPQLNPSGGGVGSNYVAPQSQLKKAPEVQAAAFPPVDAVTDARAREIMAADVPPPVAQANMRQTPIENQPGMQLAANYPDLHSIPPTPTTGVDGDAARLARVRAQLEAERNNADAARTQLSTDAAAEPSLLNEPGVVPPPMPINSAPLPPQSSNTAYPSVIAQLPPPPPPITQSSGTAWDRAAPMSSTPPPYVAAAPTIAPAMEPIILRAPGSNAEPAAAPRLAYSAPAPAAPVAGAAMAPAMSGGFNPMANGDAIVLRAPTSYAGGTAYLPNSRYATRRN